METVPSNQACKQNKNYKTARTKTSHNLPSIVERIPTKILIHPTHSRALYRTGGRRRSPAEHPIIAAAPTEARVSYTPDTARRRSSQSDGRHWRQRFPAWRKGRRKEVTTTSSDADFAAWWQS